jgi:hypothetical protein
MIVVNRTSRNISTSNLRESLRDVVAGYKIKRMFAYSITLKNEGGVGLSSFASFKHLSGTGKLDRESFFEEIEKMDPISSKRAKIIFSTTL